MNLSRINGVFGLANAGIYIIIICLYAIIAYGYPNVGFAAFMAVFCSIILGFRIGNILDCHPYKRTIIKIDILTCVITLILAVFVILFIINLFLGLTLLGIVLVAVPFSFENDSNIFLRKVLCFLGRGFTEFNKSAFLFLLFISFCYIFTEYKLSGSIVLNHIILTLPAGWYILLVLIAVFTNKKANISVLSGLMTLYWGMFLIAMYLFPFFIELHRPKNIIFQEYNIQCKIVIYYWLTIIMLNLILSLIAVIIDKISPKNLNENRSIITIS